MVQTVESKNGQREKAAGAEKDHGWGKTGK